MTGWVLGYQATLLQGAWPSMDSWLAMCAWLVAGGLVLELLLRRSRDQLVDWL